MSEFQRAPFNMSEGWEDWPLLGPGWKRRTAVRKSGQSSGQSDTYYQSPTGQRFRSKPELSKYLGASVDLTCFNFKRGTLIPLEKRQKTKKKKKKKDPAMHLPASPVACQPPDYDESDTSFPLHSPEQQNGADPKSLVCCEGCKVWFTGVEFGRSKRTVWYCASCRASRRAFNKEQRRLKSVGCGQCSSCTLTEDCGYCSMCLLRSHNPGVANNWKCVKRRCQKPILQPDDCGVCPGCTAIEDCKACTICLKKQENPESERRRCLKRRCHEKKPGPKSKALKGPPLNKLKLKTKWTLMSEQDGSCLPSKPKKWKKAAEQDGGTLPAKKKWKQKQTLEEDGKPLQVKQKKKSYYSKVKGKMEKRRQKEKNIPVNLKGSSHPVILERLKREKCSEEEKTVEEEKVAPSPQVPVIQLMPRLPVIKLERLDHRNGGYTATDDSRGGWVIGKVEPKKVKEECVESVIGVQAIQEEPLDLHCPVKEDEFITETDDIDEADESTPVITQIFSLGALNPNNRLDTILQEFLAELSEMPLPAHWEVVSDSGPTLQLVQRSKASTMADTVVHIQPGLHFHIVVRDYTVPSFHELYRKHPSRLTTVDEVVELICDLEAYRPCAGLPRGGLRSPNCEVLVYEDRCPECILNPWPSGMGF